jgi:hypothetical protein
MGKGRETPLGEDDGSKGEGLFLEGDFTSGVTVRLGIVGYFES